MAGRRMTVNGASPISDGVSIVPLHGVPRITSGDDLPGILVTTLSEAGISVTDTDALVVAQKVVSKAEGAVVDLRDVTPGAEAMSLAAEVDKDPRIIEVILGQSVRIVRKVRGVLITETVHGLICANAGVDASNSLGESVVTLLPVDADKSAYRVFERLRESFGVEPGVVVSDSFNRPWREGSVNVAIGVAGFYPLADGVGDLDDAGRVLKSTRVSVADEIASAAQLVMGETGGVPAALVRGLRLRKSNAGSAVLKRDPARDLFR